MKAFLSHSWAQKGFVEKIGNAIGRDLVIEDKYNFDAKSLSEEFKNAIKNSDLFVSLISEESLNSPRAQEELQIVCPDVFSKKITYMAFIIDNRINVNDSRIPDWVSQFRIVTTFSPMLIGKYVREECLQKIWQSACKTVDVAKARTFIGRGEEIDQLYAQIMSNNGQEARAILLSGMPYIGKKRMLIEFIKTKIEKNLTDAYTPITIRLEPTDQIDQFMLYLNEYVGAYTIGELQKEMLKGTENMVQVCADLLNKLEMFHQFIIVDDDAAIITRERTVSEWFAALVACENLLPRLQLYVASVYSIHPQREKKFSKIIFAHLDCLDAQDAETLYNAFSKQLEIELNSELRTKVLNAYIGFPDQILNSILDIRKYGAPYAERYFAANNNMFKGRYSSILKLVGEDEKRMQVLICLTLLGMSNLSLIEEIFNDTENLIDYMIELSEFSVISQIGSNKEFFIVNPSIAELIKREHIPLKSSYQKNLTKVKKHLMEMVVENNALDLTENIIAIKEKIRNNIDDIDDAVMLPSFVLKVLVEEYHAENYEKVIKLAQWMLYKTQNYQYKDYIRSIRYWLCLAYCKLRLIKDFQQEVSYFLESNSKYTYHFLIGFSYRQTGYYNKAKVEYEKAIEGQERNKAEYLAKARQELIIVYSKLNLPDEALRLAKASYEKSPSNAYHIQAYFRSLIRSNEPDIDILNKLMMDIRDSVSGNKQILLKTFEIEYDYFINKNFADDIINRLLEILDSKKSKSKIYVLDTLHDICRRENKLGIYFEEREKLNIQEDAIFDMCGIE